MITELIKGKTFFETKETTNEVGTDVLGGLHKIKLHCSVLAEDALKAVLKYTALIKIKVKNNTKFILNNNFII